MNVYDELALTLQKFTSKPVSSLDMASFSDFIFESEICNTRVVLRMRGPSYLLEHNIASLDNKKIISLDPSDIKEFIPEVTKALEELLYYREEINKIKGDFIRIPRTSFLNNEQLEYVVAWADEFLRTTNAKVIYDSMCRALMKPTCVALFKSKLNLDYDFPNNIEYYHSGLFISVFKYESSFLVTTHINSNPSTWASHECVSTKELDQLLTKFLMG